VTTNLLWMLENIDQLNRFNKIASNRSDDVIKIAAIEAVVYPKRDVIGN